MTLKKGREEKRIPLVPGKRGRNSKLRKYALQWKTKLSHLRYSKLFQTARVEWIQPSNRAGRYRVSLVALYDGGLLYQAQRR